MAHPKPFSIARLVRRYALPLSALALVAVLLLLYLAGFRLGPGLSVVRVGTVALQDVPADASVYVNGKLRSISRDAGDYRVRLTPGTHTIIVSVPDAVPWQDAVSVSSGATVSVKPIIVSLRPGAEVLPEEEYAAGLRVMQAAALPTEAAPLRAGCMDVYLSQNRIIGKAGNGCEMPPDYLCTEGECAPTVLFAPVNRITSVALFPGREDALFFTIGDDVYLIDLDPREPRYFAPFTRAVDPKVAAESSTTLLLQDVDGIHRYTF